MPLYEYRCEACGITFEALVRQVSSAGGGHDCPKCGRRAGRIISAANFRSGPGQPPPSVGPQGARPDVTSLKLPPAARLCWMDDQSASRLAAYRVGRGAEYDDTVAARREAAASEGKAPLESGVHHHSDSPLANPRILANRRKAAQKAKLAESAKITKPKHP